MDMKPVKSSNIVALGHDEKTSTLAVQFKSGTYHYAGVSAQAYQDALGAESVGKHIGANVIGKYEHTKQEVEK